MQLEHGWNGNSRRKRPSATPSSRFLHRLHTKLQRCLPLLQLLAVGIVCLAAGLLGGIVLHKRLGSTHIYCTTQPYFASSKQDVECEAWAARQQSVIATRVERQLPAHCMGIPYLSQVVMYTYIGVVIHTPCAYVPILTYPFDALSMHSQCTFNHPQPHAPPVTTLNPPCQPHTPHHHTP